MTRLAITRADIRMQLRLSILNTNTSYLDTLQLASYCLQNLIGLTNLLSGSAISCYNFILQKANK